MKKISEEVKKALQKSVMNEIGRLLSTVKNKSNTFGDLYKEYLKGEVSLVNKGIFYYAQTFEVNFVVSFSTERGIILEEGKKEAKEVSDWLQGILNSSKVNIYKNVKVSPTNLFCEFNLKVLM